MAENDAEQKAGSGLVKKLLIFGGGGLLLIAIGLGAGFLIFGSAQPDPSEEIEEIIERKMQEREAAEAEEADIEVVDADLKIDTYRASGAGGQHVNKTESAIRITHIPTGLVVTCQDETSQHKNKAAALKVLRSRLLAAEQDKIAKERAAARKNMVSTGDRSAKIRTYNFPQGRITDHRINFTAYNLEGVMNGQIDSIIENLKLADQQSQLASFVDDHE